MPKKAKKKKLVAKKATKKNPVQSQLVDLCELVNQLNQKIAELQLEIRNLRDAPPRGTIPPIQPPYMVDCESKFRTLERESAEDNGRPPTGLMYNTKLCGNFTKGEET